VRIVKIRKLIDLLIIFVIVVTFNVNAHSQTKKISVSIGGGIGYLPVEPFGEVETYFPYSKSKRSKFGRYFQFKLKYHITVHHGIVFSIGSIGFYAKETEYKDVDYTLLYVEEDLQSDVIGLSYEYTFLNNSKKNIPFIGIGAAKYSSRIDTKRLSSKEVVSVYRSPYQNDYGFHVYIGSHYVIKNNYYIEPRLCIRYLESRIFGFFTFLEIGHIGADLIISIGYKF